MGKARVTTGLRVKVKVKLAKGRRTEGQKLTDNESEKNKNIEKRAEESDAYLKVEYIEERRFLKSTIRVNPREH